MPRFLLRFLRLGCLISQGVMKNNPLIYRRPSKWPIAAALAAAVIIHLSAVAIAFHQEPSATQPAAIDSKTIGADLADDPPTPAPDLDISVPPPVPVPAADFIEPQKTRRVIKTQRTPPPIRPFGQTPLAAVGNAKAFVISAPRPDYPYEARSRHITGSGIAVITVDPNSGLAMDAVMAQSIGNAILDNSTVSAFRRWRFKPGTPAQVRIPITFVLTGAQY
jgi:TonB family protein